jgi:hypothetical protein
MKKLIERLLDAVIRWVVLHKKPIDPNSLCYACGARKGRLSYDPTLQRVIKQCDVCGAARPILPRVPAHLWDFTGKALRASEDYERILRDRFDESLKKPLAKVEQ